MDWNAITAIASMLSMLAIVATAIFVALELRGLDKTRYVQISSELYTTWQSRDFMEAQLWLIHRLQDTSWASFVATHRADYGEQAFHRVGSFYDRVGTLIRLQLIGEKEILSTIGPYAIAVWQKIQPLVREARKVEHSTLFDDFERMMPACYECYVPSLKVGEAVAPFEVPGEPPRISVRELHERMNRQDRFTLLDVRRGGPAGSESERLPGAVVMDPDEVPARLQEIQSDQVVVAYCT